MEEENANVLKNFPLHYHVWRNDHRAIRAYLAVEGRTAERLEQLDPRGRTPLMLAVTLERMDCVHELLARGANVNLENREGFTAVQEAVATGNFHLLQAVLQKRDLQRHTSRMTGVPTLLNKLKEAPDFYMEMKWEFTSWVPLVSRMCPSDTYKVYKQGSNVRIDTTLLGFDQNSWQRGNKSYLFKVETPVLLWGKRSYVYKLTDDNEKALLVEMDHEGKEVYVEELRTMDNDDVLVRHMVPSDNAVRSRLTAPIVTTYLDTDKISFERNKSGIWGWRSDKTDIVNGRECKVFSASNVELVTKTRTEHLSAEDKDRGMASSNQRFPLTSLLAVGQQAATSHVEGHDEEEVVVNVCNPDNVTMDEYFNADVDLGRRDIGRPKEMTTKVQKFKATLWLCEDFPLDLADQIMPIVDLMAISSTHFAKLRDFIQMQLPSGFPTKIEIPLFHVMNACITFGNTFALDEPVTGVSTVQEADRLSCVVDESCFETPSDYLVYGTGARRRPSDCRRQFSMDEEDELLQYAIQQSLIDAGSEGDQVDIWEALKAAKPTTPQPIRSQRSPLPPRPSSACNFRLSPEEELLQRAIEASLGIDSVISVGYHDADDENASERTAGGGRPAATVEEDERRMTEALAISARETALDEERRLREDAELLQRIIELSMMEK